VEVLALLCFFVLGTLAGTQINRGIYRLAWQGRLIGPWSPPLPEAPPRGWFDFVPVLGWLSLRRESLLHGSGFWVRPFLIELATGVCFAALYWYEVLNAAIVPAPAGSPAPGSLPLPPDAATLHAQYLGHLLLFSLMLVATFIDFDEQTIPDAITIPGTLLGLLLAAACPISRPIAVMPRGEWFAEHLNAVSACKPPNWLVWLTSLNSLWIGLACFLGWSLAVVPWLWTTRRGLRKAFQFLAASFWRRLAPSMIVATLLGGAAIVLVWAIGNSPTPSPWHHWESLFSALVGVAAGGGLIWAVRIVGSHALGQEAMGFGDVTLMAMIGAFTGWQATLIIFFLAPFAALIIAVSQWLITRRRDIAFGPYLCLATCYLVVNWGRIWNSAWQIFSLGTFVPGIMIFCLAMMGFLLLGLRWLKGG